ncbi:MAG: hypothetical protein OEZ30_04305 [Candidatus Aminicenantes bacterium]|nr:hypothetical protein [Candidatus Aminicenantes bacterium]
MARRNAFIVYVLLIFILCLSGILFGQRVIDLDKVWGDMRVLGDEASDEAGYSVAYGDVNGDGYMDIIIGAPYADPGDPPRSNAGKVYVIFGSSSPSSTIDLNTVSADITIYGDDEDDRCGWSVASGDINNDGYDDIIIGAIWATPLEDAFRHHAGETYVIFGSSLPPSEVDLNSVSAGMTIYGDDFADYSGWAVASININGDAYMDVVIGAYQASPAGGSSAGETYVIFGSTSPLGTIDLASVSADIKVCGNDSGDWSGCALAGGDINNDGYNDLIIGAYLAALDGKTKTGETYVIFGESFSTPPITIDLNSVLADITVHGANDYDWSGYAVASGDINGDDYDDVIIGAYGADSPGGTMAGKTYVIFGATSPPSDIDLSTTSADITIYGDDTLDCSGLAVASGDANNDGYEDVIIGAPNAYPPYIYYPGETYIIFGSSLPPAVIDLDQVSADVTIYGDDVGDYCGYAVACGDINGDGFKDVIIGAPHADPGDPPRSVAGETYVILGGGPLVTAHGLGGKSWIKEFDIYGNSIRSFKAFGTVNSQGEVHLAVGDTDADGHDEIAAGQGEGAKSWVKFFEVDGSIISTFKAFGAANTNGELHLAIGNFDAETADNEIAIAQGEGGQSWVKTFETDGTLLTSFKAFGAANAQGEVHLAAGDLENADGIDEIVAGMGEGGSSWVKIFSYFGTAIHSFKAFESTDNPGGEVHLAVGNFDADADLEIAASTGYNGGNKVRLFEKDGTLIRQFPAFGTGGNPYGDVQIAAADIDNDGTWEIICAHGEGGGSWVKVFKADGTVIRTFKAFGGVNAQGEVHLGKSNY